VFAYVFDLMGEAVRAAHKKRFFLTHTTSHTTIGQVLAGMLGKLSPRFHLMGEAVWAAHKLEASAAVNAVQVGEHVQLMLDSMG